MMNTIKDIKENKLTSENATTLGAVHTHTHTHWGFIKENKKKKYIEGI